MRFLKLNLTAFGPFTDASLDLSSGEHGLHVIYGPNEAGKSSSLRAITDFFYGFRARTPDSFVHGYPQLRIGAQLKHSDGTLLDVVRRKANQKSLRLGDDVTPLEESELSRFLGDVDRDLFEIMFGIDHECLRRGGAEIVKGGGRIGELLFAAGAGLAGLKNVQTKLQNDIDALLKSSGRSGSIYADINDYVKTQGELKKSQVSVETWKSHDEALRTAQNGKNALDEAIRKRRSEQNRLARIRDAIVPIAKWKKASSELAELGDVPHLPDDFADTSYNIRRDLSNAKQKRDDAESAISRIDFELKDVSVPTELLAEADEIESLRERLGSYRKAMRDRPNLETSRELAESKAKEILRKLGRAPDLSMIEELNLPSARTIRIQELGNGKQGLVERLDSARRECEKIRGAIDKAEAKLAEIQVPREPSGLRNCVRDVQKEGDLESQLDALRKEIQRENQDAAVALKRLPLWSGTLDAAEQLAVPSLSTVERFNEEINETNRKFKSLQSKLHDEVAAAEKLTDQLRQLELQNKVPTQDELDAMRLFREQGWQLVLKAWQEGQHGGEDVDAFVEKFDPLQTLPQAYHRSVVEADQIADLLRSDADRVATKSKLQADHDQRIGREAAVQSEIARTEADLQSVESRWTAVWKPLGITPLSPTEMRDWLRQQQDISQAAGRIRAKQLEAGQLKERIDLLLIKLASALKQVEPSSTCEDRSLRELVLIAATKQEEINDAKNKNKELTDRLESDRAELRDAESRFVESEVELTTWQTDWAAEMQRLGLQIDAVPAQANSVLADISELFKEFQAADQLRKRIEGIDTEAREFEAGVRNLGRRVAPGLANKPVDETVGSLTSRLQAARSAEEAHRSWLERYDEEQEKLKTAQGRILEINATLDEMCRQAGCELPDQLSEAARRSSRRRDLERSVHDHEQQIISQSGGADFLAFVAEVEHAAADVDSLSPRIDELETDIERLGHDRDEVVRQIERAESELRQIDGSGVAAEKAALCESIAARLDDQVQQLAALRAASAILHAGIEQHRKKNQGPVLGRASEIFRRLTLGGFDELRADFNERGEPILTGVRNASDLPVHVSGMSDGTCDQLYLALRIASLEAWLDHHEPLPLIVDDVLLNFDDERSIAGLQVLAELSRRTQVIFFTHHQHLVELATRNLSNQDVFVKPLASRLA